MPDFRNLGVLFWAGIIAEGGRVSVALLGTGAGFGDAVRDVVTGGGLYEAIVLTSLCVLFLVTPALRRLAYRQACIAVVLISMAVALAWQGALGGFTGNELWRTMLATALASGLILWYFNWRHRVLSPALAEARLKALQARIRPHFLFNSLNTVLGLLREDPRRAERVLENLSDLFRALLAETGTLLPLEREIAHARAYAEIEAMRLGPRLTVNWQYHNAPLDALVPPLILQPLLENAVYHGIEPAEAGGTVSVTIFRKEDQVTIVMRNPAPAQVERRPGNRMALDNIRERLALHFDAEAELSAFSAGGEFVVQIRMPYKRAETA